MPIQIDGVRYFTAADIQRTIGVIRQTLWRWRKAGRVPGGYRYRDRQVVFTEQEVEAIREYANRLEPEGVADPNQIRLFNISLPKRTAPPRNPLT